MWGIPDFSQYEWAVRLGKWILIAALGLFSLGMGLFIGHLLWRTP